VGAARTPIYTDPLLAVDRFLKDEIPMDSVLFDAIEFAVYAHRGHFRKGTGIPYIVHPLNVARTLLEFGCSEVVVIAGILHDTVEDTSVAIEDVQVRFGEEVANLVSQVSEPDKSDTWENRKRHTLMSLESASEEVLLIALADKLDNIQSIRRALEWEGDAVWSRFKRPMDAQAWYYRNLVDVFQQRVTEEPGLSLYNKLQTEVEQVFQGVDSTIGLA
jgi:(p)ppGpp synthase/HD superfamily hydrolase